MPEVVQSLVEDKFEASKEEIQRCPTVPNPISSQTSNDNQGLSVNAVHTNLYHSSMRVLAHNRRAYLHEKHAVTEKLSAPQDTSAYYSVMNQSTSVQPVNDARANKQERALAQKIRERQENFDSLEAKEGSVKNDREKKAR